MNKKSIFLIFLVFLPLVMAIPGPPPILADSMVYIENMDLGQVLTLRYSGDFCSRYELHLVMYDDNHPYFFFYKRTGSECGGSWDVSFITSLGYNEDFKVDPIDVNSTKVKFEKQMGSFGTMSFKVTVTDPDSSLAYVGVKSLCVEEMEMELEDKFQILFSNTIYDIVLKEINPDQTAVILEISKNGETLTPSYTLNVTQMCIEFAKDSKRMIVLKYRLYEGTIIFMVYHESGITVKKGGVIPPPSTKNLLDWQGIQKINGEEYLIVEAPYQSTKVLKTLTFTYDGTKTLYYIASKWVNPDPEYATEPLINTDIISPIASTGSVGFNCRFAEDDKVWHIQNLQVYQDLPTGPEIVSEVVVYFHRSDPSYTLETTTPAENYSGEKWIFSLKIGDEIADPTVISRIEVNGASQSVTNPFDYVPTEKGTKNISFVVGTKVFSKSISVIEREYTPNYQINAPSTVKINQSITITITDTNGRAIDTSKVTSFKVSGVGISIDTCCKLTVDVIPDSEGTISVSVAIDGNSLSKTIAVEKEEVKATVATSAKNKTITINPTTPDEIDVSIDGEEMGTISEQTDFPVEYGTHKVTLSAEGYEDYVNNYSVRETTTTEKEIIATVEYNKEENDFDINITTPSEGTDSVRVYYSKTGESYVLTSLNTKPKGGYYYKFVLSKEGYKDKTIYCDVPQKQFFLLNKWILIPLGVVGAGVGGFFGYRFMKKRKHRPIKTESTKPKEIKEGPKEFKTI